jgi:hypothetical protein
MAECARHPQARTVDVRGTAYCEECLAARLKPVVPPPPAPGLPNPTVAGVLGVLPGVGAFYNGQYEKGIFHVLLFVMLVAMAEASDGFLAILIPFYFAYLVIDAHKTARARQRGEPLPDYLALRAMFGSGDKPISAAFGRVAEDAAAPAAAATPLDAEPAERRPWVPIVLIVLGVLLLFGNMGWVPSHVFTTFWPVVLIVIGILQGRRRLRARL